MIILNSLCLCVSLSVGRSIHWSVSLSQIAFVTLEYSFFFWRIRHQQHQRQQQQQQQKQQQQKQQKQQQQRLRQQD